MASGPGLPAELQGAAALRYMSWFFLDPLSATRRLSRENGNFVRLHPPIRVGKLPSEIVFAARSDLNREILGRPNIWRTVDITTGGKRGHATRRLVNGLVRMRGAQHAYYRKLIVPPLRQHSVDQLGEKMAATAASVVSQWPVGEAVDLWALVRNLMQRFAIALLFGADFEKGSPIADMINRLVRLSWSFQTNLVRLDVPGLPYARVLRSAEQLEVMILDWARSKSATIDPHDLLSIIVNSPDENGKRPDDALLTGHVPTLFGAAYETCQNAMIWSLILLMGHPRIAADLVDELDGLGAGGPSDLAALHRLPLLDAVVKESLRILPPVPNQYRVALEDTTLAACTLGRGARAVLSAFVINRDPDLYPEPDRFRPDRWKSIAPGPFEFAVFSGGPRSCPGHYFGTSVVKAALAAILTRHVLEPAANQRIGYRVGVTLSPSAAMMVRFRPRGAAPEGQAFVGRLSDLVRFPSLQG